MIKMMETLNWKTTRPLRKFFPSRPTLDLPFMALTGLNAGQEYGRVTAGNDSH